MDFNLSKEQELLRDGLDKFLSTRYDLEKSRAAAKTGPGWQPDIWRGFADELGILGAALPEEVSGIGGGAVEIMVIAEALGHALVVEPYIDTAVVAGGLLRRAGGGVATALLEKIVAGTAIVALAASEAVSGERWQDVSTVAERDGDEWVLGGSKIVAVSAPLATHLLITARTPSGISLFVVETDTGAPGIEAHHYRTVDDRRASDLVIDGLRLPGSALLGEEGQAWASLAQARDEGAAAVCAEAVGCMRKVLADTVEYCKQRQQFGQPIGSFQVLQHRMVDMYMELEQAVAAVYLAVLNLETEPAVRARAVSAAKATVGRAARFIGQQAVQLHGGMGMTEELAIGHYFKRLTALQYEFGSTDYHVARYASLTSEPASRYLP
jgi:alkylation response protein AidB-like acyl-CoA dehydrogenase